MSASVPVINITGHILFQAPKPMSEILKNSEHYNFHCLDPTRVNMSLNITVL